jgi:hypothetical protein
MKELPEFVSQHQAAEIIGISPYDVMGLVVTKVITSSSYTQIPLKAVGDYVKELKGWDGEYTDLFIHQTLNGN